MKTYRGGIVGCGLIAPAHAEAYADNKNVELAAVCDKQIGLAKRLARSYGVKNAYGDYRKMMDEEELDFVEVLTNHSSHLEIVKAAAERGLHVNLQKVPAPTLQEFNEIREIAAEREIKLRIIENFRYYPPYLFAKDLIQKGVVGEPQVVNIKMWMGLLRGFQGGFQRLRAYHWRFFKEEENHLHSVIFDDGYHKHSLIEFFLEEPVEKVRAWSKYQRIYGLRLDAPTQVEYHTQSGRLGTYQPAPVKIEVTNNFYPCDEVIEIIGTKGIILIFGGHGQLFSERQKSSIKRGVHWVAKSGTWNFSDEMNLDIRDSFLLAMEEYVKFLEGSDDLVFDLQDAENALRAGLGVIKSLKNDSSLVHLGELQG